MTITHSFVSAKADGTDSTLVKPSNWNADHIIGDGTLTINSASSVATFTLSSGTLVALTFNTTDGVGVANSHVLDLGSNASDVTVQNASAGAVGPSFVLYQNSASPAVSDVVGAFYFYGEDSASNTQKYASIVGTITNATSTSEGSEIQFNALRAGTEFAALTLNDPSDFLGVYGHTFDYGGAANPDFTIKSTEAGQFGPSVNVYQDSASPAANDYLGFWGFYGRDSAGNVQNYSYITSIILDPTSTTEDAKIVFNVIRAGAGLDAFTIGPGVQVGAPTGGDLGTGTINVATSISLNNTAYTNPDYALEHWATGKIELFKDNDGAAHYRGLTPLDGLEDFMLSNYRLPGIDDDSGRCIFERSDICLEKVEEAFIYITQLHKRLKQLEDAKILH